MCVVFYLFHVVMHVGPGVCSCSLPQWIWPLCIELGRNGHLTMLVLLVSKLKSVYESLSLLYFLFCGIVHR